MLPDKLVISKENLSNLKAISKWYNSCPLDDGDGFYAGDNFHERVFEYQFSLIPALGDKWDVNYFQMTDEGEMVVWVYRYDEEKDVYEDVELPIAIISEG